MNTNKLSQFIMTLVLINTLLMQSNLWAQTTTATGTTPPPDIATQQSNCSANSAMVWDTTLNRCMNKIQEQQYQKASADCGKLTDLDQRKSCQMNLASQQSGVTSDAESAMSNNSSLQNRSALINSASTVISVLNMLSSQGGNSTCMSKNILSYTGIAGTVTDILMKIKTKNVTNDLKDKYQVSKADSPYTAQTKALEYLKDEQSTVKDMAVLEKKRQTLLMIGYAAAFATAAFEQMTNSTCANKKTEVKPEAKPEAKLEAKPEAKQEVITSSSIDDTKSSVEDCPAHDESCPQVKIETADETPPPADCKPGSQSSNGKEPCAPVPTPTSTAAGITSSSQQEIIRETCKNPNLCYQNVIGPSTGQVVAVNYAGQRYESPPSNFYDTHIPDGHGGSVMQLSGNANVGTPIQDTAFHNSTIQSNMGAGGTQLQYVAPQPKPKPPR